MIKKISQLWQQPIFSGVQEDRSLPWILACSSLAAGVVLISVLFWEAIGPAVALWRHNNAYNYCFLIIPIAIALAYTKRDQMSGLVPTPSPWGVAVIAVFGVLWCLTYVSGVSEGMQFAVVGIIQGLLLSLFGGVVYRRLWVPFTVLWLLVPTGQFLVPLLQTATAIGASALLPLSGFPTYHEHFVILAPHGTYEVAPGCSGLSFLLASLVVGVVFAELTYYRWQPKLLFVSGLLFLSIVGNSVRVFLIIAVAEWTGNVGDILEDHLFYGWGFFSLLLLGAISLGHRYHDRPQPLPEPVAVVPTTQRQLVGIAGLSLIAVAIPSITTTMAWSGTARGSIASPILSCGNFTPTSRLLDGGAVASHVDGQAAVTCERAGHRVRMTLAVLNRPVRQGKLLGLERQLIDQESWSRLRVSQATTLVEGQAVPVQAEWLGHGDSHRLIWSLFWVDGAWRVAGLDALWSDIKADLVGRRQAVLVQISSDDVNDEQSVGAELNDFLTGLPLRKVVVDSLDSGKP